VDLDIVFLGTSASAPTARRGTSALLVRRGGDRLLLDCGEGTQRQLLRSSVGLVDLEDVFLTHLHADHYLGLPGMLKTFSLRMRDTPLTVYGPVGLRDLFQSLGRVVGRLTYQLELVELRPARRSSAASIACSSSRSRTARQPWGTPSPRPTAPAGSTSSLRTLGVPAGPERGALQRGEAVTLGDGRTVTPADVLGPPRAGRMVVYTGDTAQSEVVGALAEAPTCSSTRRPSARTRPTGRRRRCTRQRRRPPRSRAMRA
jgi:ribonuclease Z